MVVFTTTPLFSQSKHAKTSNYLSYKGLVMAGYQGWFRAPNDGSKKGWGHYGRSNKFDFENNTIDFWPDVSEYKKTYKTISKTEPYTKRRKANGVSCSSLQSREKPRKGYDDPSGHFFSVIDLKRALLDFNCSNRQLLNPRWP